MPAIWELLGSDEPSMSREEAIEAAETLILSLSTNEIQQNLNNPGLDELELEDWQRICKEELRCREKIKKTKSIGYTQGGGWAYFDEQDSAWKFGDPVLHFSRGEEMPAEWGLA